MILALKSNSLVLIIYGCFEKVFCLRKAGTEPSSGLSLVWNFLYFQIDIIRLDLSVFCSLAMFCVNRPPEGFGSSFSHSKEFGSNLFDLRSIFIFENQITLTTV
jgi:hypothetical protein